MISMYAQYSGRTLYVALSSDTIEGAKNGDKLYEMDTGKRYVYNEKNGSWDEQHEEGGGPTYESRNLSVVLSGQTGNVQYARYSPTYSAILYGAMTSYTAGATHSLPVAVQDGKILLYINKNFAHIRQNGIEIPHTKSNYYYTFNYDDIPLPNDTSTYPITFSNT